MIQKRLPKYSFSWTAVNYKILKGIPLNHYNLRISLIGPSIDVHEYSIILVYKGIGDIDLQIGLYGSDTQILSPTVDTIKQKSSNQINLQYKRRFHPNHYSSQVTSSISSCDSRPRFMLIYLVSYIFIYLLFYSLSLTVLVHQKFAHRKVGFTSS